MTLLLVIGAAPLVHAQAPAETPPSEETEPRTIGTTGTTMVGLSGNLDRFYSSERILPTNYTAQIDVSRFITEKLVVRGGLIGSGSYGGDDAADRPVGLGVPSLHATGGLFYYFTPRSIWSVYSGAAYRVQMTQRVTTDRGSALGVLGLEGAVSSRASLFLEGGYGVGLTGADERTTRLVGNIGVRLRF